LRRAFLVVQRADVKCHHEKLFSFEPWIDFLRVDLAANEKSGANERHESERRFNHDQQAADRIAAPSDRVAAPACLQGVSKVG
jgi:hypothetical protein